jgi:probable HAF family extracellular repeat protein
MQVPMIVGASYMATISLLPHPLDEPQTAGVNPLSFVGSIDSTGAGARGGAFREGIMRRLKLWLCVAVVVSPLFANLRADATTYNFTTIDVPSSTFTFANGINDVGQIVGGYSNGGSGQGFVYSGGLYSTIIVPSATGNTFAYGINNGGQIAGVYVGNGGIFGYSGSSTLAVPGAAGGTSAQGINAQGQVVGYFFNSSSVGSGFLYSNGIYTTLQDPSSAGDTYAYGINNKDQIVGFYAGGHGFLYENGTFTTLHDPAAGLNGTTYAQGINNTGQIVGAYAGSGGGYSSGFLYSGGIYTTINDPLGLGTALFGINDAGQIVGEYFDSDGTMHGFLATPAVPESSTWAMLLIGFAGIGFAGFLWPKHTGDALVVGSGRHGLTTIIAIALLVRLDVPDAPSV